MTKKATKTSTTRIVKQMFLISPEQKAWFYATAKRTGHKLSELARAMIEEAIKDTEFDVKLRRVTMEARLNALAAKTEALLKEKEAVQKELQNLVKE